MPMNDAGEKNDKGHDKEESIPTASMGGSAVGPGGQGSVPTADLDDSTVGPGGQIGPYKLLSKLGEGGFAEVIDGFVEFFVDAISKISDQRNP
jgi:hypothetical protein